MEANKKIKVLIIRFSSIGDIVLCTPVLRCLKKIPGKEIELHFLTKNKFAGFVKQNPNVDKVFALEKKLKDLLPQLKNQQYNYIIDLHNNIRSHLVKFYLQKPSQSFSKLSFKKWLLTKAKIDLMPDVHIVDRYMAAAKGLGLENDGEGLDYFIPEADEVNIEKLPEPFQQGYIAFVIGGTYVTKRLPQEKIASICKNLTQPVVLLGGPEDKETGEAIALQLPEKVFNACGKFTLNGSASLVKQSTGVISHDTGLMHIAAAFDKPIASIWGNTTPELGMYPYFPENSTSHHSKIFEVKNLSCRPCSRIGYNACPKKHFKCMHDIQEHDIVSWVENIRSVCP